jgi:hypothetical protein
MNVYKKLLGLAAVLSFLLPAAAAECTPELDKATCRDQVKVAMVTTRSLLGDDRIDRDVATPLSLPFKQPTKMLRQSVGFSEQGSTMRWLYSTVATKRVFATYTGPQRSRPAELRITVRLSLL